MQSEQFAVAVGLAARVQRAVEGELARTTRRVLHRLNLPAGTDVSRILNEIGQLRVQVRELTAELEEARAELAEAERRRRPCAPAPVKRRGPEGVLMVATISPGELVERVRRDAERNVLRVRNGLKHLAGVGRPQLTQTPKETVWAAEKVELWHYPSDRRALPHAAAVHPQPRVAQLRVRPRARQQLRRDDASTAGFDVYLVDWGVPDELESGNTLETYTDGYIPTIVARGAAPDRQRPTSTCSATASAACCRCCRWPATRTSRCAAWP